MAGNKNSGNKTNHKKMTKYSTLEELRAARAAYMKKWRESKKNKKEEA